MSEFRNADEYREYLEGLSYEELLGEDFLQQEAEEEIDTQCDALCVELEDKEYAELLGESYLEQLAEEEIDRRVEAFEESDEGKDQ